MSFYDYWFGIVRPFLGPTIGLLLSTFVFNWPVKMIVRITKSDLRFESAITDPNLLKKWITLAQLDSEKGSRYLGYLERTILFLSLAIGKYEIAGGWLAFKLAAKWQSWDQVVQIPQKLSPLMDDVQFLHVRHIWGTRLLNTFLVGTAANIVAAFIGQIFSVVINFLINH